MNIHNKLKEFGFKKCGFYRSEKNKEEGWKMVRDDVEVYFNIVDGKYIRKTRFKNHSKSSAVYKMKMNTKVTYQHYNHHQHLKKLVQYLFHLQTKYLLLVFVWFLFYN